MSKKNGKLMVLISSMIDPKPEEAVVDVEVAVVLKAVMEEPEAKAVEVEVATVAEAEEAVNGEEEVATVAEAAEVVTEAVNIEEEEEEAVVTVKIDQILASSERLMPMAIQLSHKTEEKEAKVQAMMRTKSMVVMTEETELAEEEEERRKKEPVISVLVPNQNMPTKGKTKKPLRQQKAHPPRNQKFQREEKENLKRRRSLLVSPWMTS